MAIQIWPPGENWLRTSNFGTFPKSAVCAQLIGSRRRRMLTQSRKGANRNTQKAIRLFERSKLISRSLLVATFLLCGFALWREIISIFCFAHSLSRLFPSHPASPGSGTSLNASCTHPGDPAGNRCRDRRAGVTTVTVYPHGKAGSCRGPESPPHGGFTLYGQVAQS